LRTLARVGGEVRLEVTDAATIQDLLDSLESQLPMLRGTIRDHRTKERRAFIRYFADGTDLSHDPASTPLPESVSTGSEAFLVVGSISGG
jgi:hypothetical protein